MTSPIGEIACRLRRPHILAMWVFDRIFDVLFDRVRGLNTSGRRDLSSRFAAKERVGYQPVSYLDFEPLLEGISRSGLFVDFGAGRGRALCLAGKFGFHGVIGVEIDPDLCATAEANIQFSGIKNFQLECIDALDFSIPMHATVFFFHNPFRGEVLRGVLSNIARSVGDSPRQAVVLVYGSPIDHVCFAAFCDHPDLTYAWERALPTGCKGMAFHVGPNVNLPASCAKNPVSPS